MTLAAGNEKLFRGANKNSFEQLQLQRVAVEVQVSPQSTERRKQADAKSPTDQHSWNLTSRLSWSLLDHAAAAISTELSWRGSVRRFNGKSIGSSIDVRLNIWTTKGNGHHSRASTAATVTLRTLPAPVPNFAKQGTPV